MFKKIINIRYFCENLKLPTFIKRIEYLNKIKKDDINIDFLKNNNYNVNNWISNQIEDNKILAIMILIKKINEIKNNLKPVQFFSFIRNLEAEIFKFIEKINPEEIIFLAYNLGSYNFINKKLMNNLEDKILDSKDFIISNNYDAPKIIIKILKGFIINNYAKSEFIYDVVEWMRLMNIENMVTLKEMCELVNILSKSSSNIRNFFGFKNVINNKIKSSCLKYGLDDIFLIYKYCHEIKIINNDVYEVLEKRIIYLLRHNLKIEEYKLNINILRNNYDVNDKIFFNLNRFIDCFIALHNNYSKRNNIIDKLQGIMLKYIEGLTNSLFEKVFISYYNYFFVNKELEILIEKELILRIKGLKERELIFMINKLSLVGIKNPLIVKLYLEKLNTLKINNFHYILKSIETIVQLQYYFYPIDLINIDLDKKEHFIKIKNLGDLWLKKCILIIKKKIDEFTILCKITDIVKILQLTRRLDNLIITNDLKEDFIYIYDNCTDIIINNSDIMDFYIKRLEIKQFDNIEIDNRNKHNYLDINQISEIFSIYSQIYYPNKDFMNKLIIYLEDNIDAINKNFFTGVYKGIQNYKKLKKSNDFIKIVLELKKYGDYKYFFKHSQYIELISSLIYNIISNYLSFIKKDEFNIISSNSKELKFLPVKKFFQILNSIFEQDITEIIENLLMININNLKGSEVKLLYDIIIFLQLFNDYVY